MYMEQDKKLIPNRLRTHRRIYGYRQKEVAHLISIKNPAEIARWEKGVKLPNTLNLLKLSIIYRTIPNELYFEFIQEMKKDIVKRENDLLKR